MFVELFLAIRSNCHDVIHENGSSYVSYNLKNEHARNMPIYDACGLLKLPSF